MSSGFASFNSSGSAASGKFWKLTGRKKRSMAARADRSGTSVRSRRIRPAVRHRVADFHAGRKTVADEPAGLRFQQAKRVRDSRQDLPAEA